MYHMFDINDAGIMKQYFERSTYCFIRLLIVHVLYRVRESKKRSDFTNRVYMVLKIKLKCMIHYMAFRLVS